LPHACPPSTVPGLDYRQLAGRHDEEIGDDGGRSSQQAQVGVGRRDFVKAGAAGLGAAALLDPGAVRAQAPAAGAVATGWDYEFDVVVVGAGCAGLTAAIRARDLGASVLVVEASHDDGGRMLQSGSFVSLGAGDPVQRRDRARARDAEGRIQVDPLEPPEALDDSVDLLFADLVDWSIVDRRGFSPTGITNAR
jgi:hypothetical protein